MFSCCPFCTDTLVSVLMREIRKCVSAPEEIINQSVMTFSFGCFCLFSFHGGTEANVHVDLCWGLVPILSFYSLVSPWNIMSSATYYVSSFSRFKKTGKENQVTGVR